MKTKRFLIFGTLIVVLVGIFIPADSVFAIASRGIDGTNPIPGAVKFIFGELADSLFRGIGYILMTISGLILTMVGKLFDLIMETTVLNMGKNLSDSSGIGGSITIAWATLRDIANMCFIFVLLFAAFKTMLDSEFGNFQKTVKDIIIIALLINFSLFFSKVVIDASNIVAIGFYKSITSTSSLTVNNAGGTSTTSTTKGISAGYMNLLGLQSWYSPNILTNSSMGTIQILITGVMGSIFMLIASVVLLITGIMFLARYIILIFLMILSPLALIAFIVPGQKGQFEKWKDALIDQSFFAPLFFALTWVVFKLASNPNFLGALKPAAGTAYTDVVTKLDTSAAALILNYVLVIGFSIAALVISKTIASKTAGFKAISGGIGVAAAGTTAWLGRTTVGWAGKNLSENARLQTATKSDNLFKRTGARMALYASEKARSGTFDVRNAAIPTNVVGDFIQGTVGRTKYGKKLGLNDVNIPSVAMSSIVKDMDMLGKGGTKGYKETKEESDKRVRDREAAAASELALAQAKKAVKDGASASVGSPMIDEMEKALAKLSDKETEALVASNRELLKSQNFANAISVKQLETLNKSDQFSEEEKKNLKGVRFKAIDDAMAAGGAGAASVRPNIRNLADSELEMINTEHLENADFVSHLKSSQFESINKSGKFTTNQKEKLRAARRKPLANALTSRNVADVEKALKALGPKEIASIEIANLKIPTMLEAYKPSLLKRMAPEMNPADVLELRDAIVTAAGMPGASTNVIKLNAWLGTADGAIFS